MTASPARRAHHNGATGKSLVSSLAVGTRVIVKGMTRDFESHIAKVRRKKKHARRYCVGDSSYCVWLRHDQIVVAGGQG
jgi:hypothetical protein